MNQHLNAHSSAVMFVTMVHAILAPKTHTLTHAKTGRDHPFVEQILGEREIPSPTGAALGIMDEIALSEGGLTLALGGMPAAHTTDSLMR